jgi:RNA-directed DNA polymerase
VALGLMPLWARASLKANCTLLTLIGSVARCIIWLRVKPRSAQKRPGEGNIYLNPLDHKMAQEGYEMVRYADDAVVCCRTATEAQKALAEIAAWTELAGLKLHPTKTRIVSAVGKGGFDFLGYHFERYQSGSGMKWPRDKSRKKLRDKLREKLRRGRSGSIADIIIEINPILKGWFGYFKFSVPSAMRDADQWVRDRIRQIVRRRHKHRGIVKGRERIEYPNRWFETQGFYSLEKAQAKWIQSPTGHH